MDPSPRRRLRWHTASVIGANAETTSARTLCLDVPDWESHVAGQHIDVRLTADDGYQATRSYSLSSGPGETAQVTVERVDGGEVSPFLVDVVEVGDTFEVRGPIGGYFVWQPSIETKPLLLIGGGSGIAPLRAIWRAACGVVPITLLYSARCRARIIFETELSDVDGPDVRIHLTREEADGYRAGRIDRGALADAFEDSEARVFVCGPTAFVEEMASHLVALGVDPASIRTERFG